MYWEILKAILGPDGKLSFTKTSQILFLFSLRYGGPCSQSVRSVFAVSWISYLASKEGIVIALVDGRGTAFQGDRLLYAVSKTGVFMKLRTRSQLSGERFSFKQKLMSRKVMQ